MSGSRMNSHLLAKTKGLCLAEKGLTQGFLKVLLTSISHRRDNPNWITLTQDKVDARCTGVETTTSNVDLCVHYSDWLLFVLTVV